MIQDTLLERKTVVFEVAGRKFEVQEFSGAAGQEYCQELHFLGWCSRKRLQAVREGSPAELWLASLDLEDAFFAQLLDLPVEWVREHLFFSMKERILTAVDELNCLSQSDEVEQPGEPEDAQEIWAAITDALAKRYGTTPEALWASMSPRQLAGFFELATVEQFHERADLYEAAGWKVDRSKAPKAGRKRRKKKLSKAERQARAAEIREGAKNVKWGPAQTPDGR